MSIKTRLEKLETIKGKGEEQECDLSKLTDRELQRQLGELYYILPSKVKDPQILEDIRTMSKAEFVDKLENMKVEDFDKYIELTMSEGLSKGFDYEDSND